MSSQAMRATPRAGAREHARQRNIEKQLERFPRKLRMPVYALASRHPRLAELSESFPALLVALAWPRAGVDTRALINAVVLGAPLKSIAKFAGVPLWMRRVEAEMMIAPLPALPDSPFVRHRIVNHLPQRVKHAAQWFEFVSTAALWVDDNFAVWCAANAKPRTFRRRGRRYSDVAGLHLLCLWAWYSQRPGTLGFESMKTRWNPEMQAEAAFDAIYDWRDDLELLIEMGPFVVEDLWHVPATVHGYEFVPLRTAGDMREEAHSQRNCLRSYGDCVANGNSQLWGIRRHGARVATLEVSRVGDDPYASIRQVWSAQNEPASRDVWLAAHAWIASQPEHEFAGASTWRRPWQMGASWRALWKPYWLAKQRVPTWLPLVPKSNSLYDL